MGSEAVPLEVPILTGIAETGQQNGLHAAVESFVQRVRGLTDEERRTVADRRSGIDEALREKALRAGAEAIARHPDLYAHARAQVAGAHLPAALEDGSTDGEWVRVSRLVQLAIDEGLVAVVGSGTLHPNHLRELIAPWPAELSGR
jgi:hypothetical protein